MNDLEYHHRPIMGSTTRRRRKSSRILGCSILLIIASFILVNIILSGLVGMLFPDNMAYSTHSSEVGIQVRPVLNSGGIDGMQKMTLPPRESSVNSAGFIHMGKTAGSTISTMIRNGCHSFGKGPCRNISNESTISKVVEHYYHVPDFWRLPNSNHKIFIISIRDVFDRTVSSLIYDHPDNAKIYNLKQTQKQKYYGPIAYLCFPTLEDFANLMINGNSTNCNYPYKQNNVVADDCIALACAAIHGKARFFTHLFFNYRNIVYTKIPTTPLRDVYVIRQEQFWNDWKIVNQLLLKGRKATFKEEEESIIIPTNSNGNERNVSGLKLPVTREISSEGRKKLCKALETEYVAYYMLLHKAINIKDDDLNECIRISKRNCPNLDIHSIARTTYEKKI